MAHITEIVKYEKLSNGQFAVVIRCCGVQSTDYPHTMSVALSGDDRSASIAAAREQSAKLHQQAMDADAAAASLVGQQVNHE